MSYSQLLLLQSLRSFLMFCNEKLNHYGMNELCFIIHHTLKLHNCLNHSKRVHNKNYVLFLILTTLLLDHYIFPFNCPSVFILSRSSLCILQVAIVGLTYVPSQKIMIHSITNVIVFVSHYTHCSIYSFAEKLSKNKIFVV